MASLELAVKIPWAGGVPSGASLLGPTVLGDGEIDLNAFG